MSQKNGISIIICFIFPNPKNPLLSLYFYFISIFFITGTLDYYFLLKEGLIEDKIACLTEFLCFAFVKLFILV